LCVRCRNGLEQLFELDATAVAVVAWVWNGPAWIRTRDQRIMSPLL
jgi:hypothetical protein